MALFLAIYFFIARRFSKDTASVYALKIFGSLCVICLIVISIVRAIIFFDLTYSFATITTQDGEYRFQLRTPIYADMTSQVFCRIQQRGSLIGETFLGISADLKGVEFTVIEQNDVVALVENSTPSIVILLIDRNNQTYWPSSNSTTRPGTETHLLERLNADQETPFSLNGDVYDLLLTLF